MLDKFRNLRNSQFVSLVAVFAALTVVCDSFPGLPWPPPGVWFSWSFMMEPLTGIVIGPYAGFLSSFIGAMIGHFIYFRGPYEFLFTLGAPIGAMVSGLMFRWRWKIVLIYYTGLLTAYFVTPVAWQLPIWAMWDVYIAYVFLLLMVGIERVNRDLWNRRFRGLLFKIVLCSFIGLEADVLFRIFLLVPGQTYWLFYGLTPEGLVGYWYAGAAETPVKVAISTLVTATVGPPLVRVIRKTSLFQKFEKEK